MPQVLLQLIAQCESDTAGMAALAQLLGNDPALSAKVLRVATSPAFHRGAQAANLERALATIGIDMVRTLLITESVYQTFNTLGASAGFDLRPFWRHAISTAISARLVARRLGYPQLEEAYLGGLLHDIGRLALASAAPDEYAVNFHADDDPGLCAREQRTLDITHAEAGAALLDRLDLDSFLADAIRYHHDPLPRLNDAHPLVRAVALGDLIAGALDAGPAAQAGVAARTGIPENVLNGHWQSLDREVQSLAKLLGVDLGQRTSQPAPPGHAGNPGIPDGGGLGDKVRDLILVSKATEGLLRQRSLDAGYRMLARAAVVLFDFADAIVFAATPDGEALAPAGLQEGRQRLAGLRLPRGGDGLAAALTAPEGVAFHLPQQRPAVAEEQLLRALAAEALVALRLGPGDGNALLLAVVSRTQLAHLRTRSALLRDFGRQAGIALDGVARQEGAEQATDSAIASEFALASRRVAHEVNNPLTIIKNYLGVLQRKAGSDQAIDKDLTVLGEEIERVAQIISEFATSRRIEAGTESAPDAALDYACRLFLESQSVNPGVRLRCIPANSEVLVHISPARLNQILLNLIKNANEAMPGGGEIELRNHGLQQRDGAEFVAITVSDNGPGMPPEVLARLYTPLHSTKGGPHRGLGLSIVHELVTAAGGSITCRSDRSGTAFDILLPALPSPAAA